MSLKNIFTFLVLATSLMLGLPSCSDDTVPPVSFITTDGSTAINSGDTLSLDFFDKGLSFEILGGRGNYEIENNHKDIVSFEYDGKALTITPQGLGIATIGIEDVVGNTFTVYIKVSYYEEVYSVKTLDSEVDGADAMQIGQVKELKNRVKDESIVQPGGRYIFTFTNEERTLGSVNIYPTEKGNPMMAVFRKEEKFSESDGKKYQLYVITLPSGDQHKMMLKEYPSAVDEIVLRKFEEDLTTTYKPEYAELEKVVLIQELNL